MLRLLEEHERFAFGDADRDPRKLFPEVSMQLSILYPGYEFVWDWQKARWACIHRPGPEKAYFIRWVESEDGTPADPSMAFLEWLKANEIADHHLYIESSLDKMERAERDEQQKLQAELDAYLRAAHLEFLNWWLRNPETSIQGVHVKAQQVVKRAEAGAALKIAGIIGEPPISTEHMTDLNRALLKSMVAHKE